MTELLPLFLNVTGRAVLIVGGGSVAAAKLQQLIAVGARVRVIAPEIGPALAALRHPDVQVFERAFVPSDLDEVWLVVAAATPAVNREVAAAADARRVFVNAVDDPANASAFLSGVVRRDGVTIAISTSGEAPALTALVREGVDALLPRDLARWLSTARKARIVWRRDGVPMGERKPLLLRALNALYRDGGSAESAAARSPFDKLRVSDPEDSQEPLMVSLSNHEPSSVPWLNAPEDSWP